MQIIPAIFQGKVITVEDGKLCGPEQILIVLRETFRRETCTLERNIIDLLRPLLEANISHPGLIVLAVTDGKADEGALSRIDLFFIVSFRQVAAHLPR